MLQTILRFVAGFYFLLTSLYCLLAFLPYTYCAFIKAPPYAWMPWFVQHQAALYWVAATSGVLSILMGPPSHAEKVNWRSVLLVGTAIAIGCYLSAHPFLPRLQSDRASYVWSLLSLFPLMALARFPSDEASARNDLEGAPALWGYSSALRVAVVVSVVYLIGSRIQAYSESHTVRMQAQFLDLAAWSVVSHLAVAIAVLSAYNLIYIAGSWTKKPRMARRWLLGLSIAVGLGIVLERFLNSAMSFDGWAANLYAFVLSGGLTVWGFSIVRPFHASPKAAGGITRPQKIAIWGALAGFIALALVSRSLIGGEDWNGFVTTTWVVVFWIAMSFCVNKLRPARAAYSTAIVVVILLVAAFTYKALQFTEIYWSKALGSTDDDISLKLEEYGGRDASFHLAHNVLGNGRYEKCGDLCRILREYTNIRDTHIQQGVALVENLAPAKGERPNIFIFVVDSMRPDYLGSYNPRVDYTPHLDALARESITFHHTYTHYAGTSISEPAIWAGAELLHTHFPQPFDEVNSLRTLARTDGYELIVSYDTVLRQLFSTSDELTKLDRDKDMWNRYEACSTLSELELHLDARPNKSQPVFFYAQPMNVHQFAHNDVPSASSQHWAGRPGMNGRITYEVHWVDSCLGGFFNYLRQRGLYEDSIIAVTSDHGDATGELGRYSHSTSIWPEIMRVPLILHLPKRMRSKFVYQDERLSTLSDIAPTLYYLLGHGPIRRNPLYGRPLLAETRQELDTYPQSDLLLASDVRAVYGILTADGRYLYTTYDSPAQSYLFDLTTDPEAQHSMLTPALKRRYDEEIIERLQTIGNYYGYKPGVGSLLALASR